MVLASYRSGVGTLIITQGEIPLIHFHFLNTFSSQGLSIPYAPKFYIQKNNDSCFYKGGEAAG